MALGMAGAAPPAAGEGAEARGWLDRMARASRSLDYVGTFVYRNGPLIQSMKIIHRADPGGSRERLVALSGAAREVIRDGHRVICILPDAQAVVITKRRPFDLYLSALPGPEPAAGPDVAEHYVLSSGGVERVAGREAAMIGVQPKDRYRYGYLLAADRQTGLLLKSELFGDGGTVLEQIVYTHLELPDSIPDEALEPRISHTGFTRYEAVVPSGAGHGPGARTEEWEVGWLPGGFRMTGESFDPIRPGGDPVDHRVYSDGLVSFSIFIERALDAGERHEGRSSVGAVNAFGRIIDGFQVSVVGEVPGITVEKVAASITKRRAGSRGEDRPPMHRSPTAPPRAERLK